MKKVYDKSIDKSADWGGDESTDNLPVAGKRIQEFIKGSLDNKIGILYYDTNSNRYLCFADEQSKDEYIENPTLVDLVLGTFDAPFNYTAEINLMTPIYNAVFADSTGNYITFTCDIKNKQGSPTGEDSLVTYTFIRNGVKQVVTQTSKHGDVNNFNVDKYISEGINSISVSIKGLTTLAATMVNITYQVVNLRLTDEADITQAYDLTVESKIMEVPFSLSGYGTKIVEWYLDGELIPHDRNIDEVVDVTATRIKYIKLENLSHGLHNLQIRAYTIIDGDKFYSNTLYRDIFVLASKVDKEDLIGVAGSIPPKYGLIPSGEPYRIFDMIQYIPYELTFATYSPSMMSTTEVEVTLGGIRVASINSSNGELNKVSLLSTTHGAKNIRLKAGRIQYNFVADVAKTSMNLQEITSGLEFDFNGIGRSNSSADRDSWSFNDYSAVFNGFNWNSTSGWVGDRLIVSTGASIEFNYAPLLGDVTSNGKTIEIEFMTTNVTNEDAVICDLRTPSGVGILITGNRVILRSENGVEIRTEFNENELVRIAFVINRRSGSNNRLLSFLYTNGIVSRAGNWIDTDSYSSNKVIRFEGTEEANIVIKQIKVYNEALSDTQLLNNYILYRDGVTSMMEVYDRNDIYLPGTNILAPDKMASQVPVMIVTGDIPVLENTSNKNTQIMVDIEYINMQNPELSFTMENAAMRPQGTSSMSYPKKNFRIYTQKLESTIVRDYLGNPIPSKLYSFTPKAAPVNCWCLKADYADSSGVNNTGIARLWNDVLFNSQMEVEGVEDRFIFRTEAQKVALQQGYPYDVRTTVDGFPILVFYRLSPKDDLIFIGKYNFNNDKSTEAIYGFVDIPGFDNSKMQCWEIRDNGHPLTLFTDVSRFDKDWAIAWESRYPDTKNPTKTLPYLKAFSLWMASVNGNKARFATEKWDHFDVYKVAAYYVYFMRFGAVDQLVKNVFLTSENGRHFYMINYDNDTIIGLLNSGQLGAPPDVTRDSTTESGEYIYAGRNSVMWNMFENDEEFMRIVPEVDLALTTYKLKYDEVINLLDRDHADHWVERVYNQDAQYKYVSTFTENKANNLYMLQGKRDLQRKWWLAKRFAFYDAKWVSGTYRSNAIAIKCENDTPPGQLLKITAGSTLSYGYGLNSALREVGVELDRDEDHTFVTTDTLNRGDVIRLYGSPQLKVIDLSAMADTLVSLELNGIFSESQGSKLEKLIIGRLDANNLVMEVIGGIGLCVNLTEINIEGLKRLTSLDLRGLANMKVVKARNSTIGSVALEKGAPIELLELPNSVNAIVLEQLPYLMPNKLVFGTSVRQIDIRGCKNLSTDFNFAYNWYKNKTTNDSVSSYSMDSIDWTDVDPVKFVEFLQLKVNGGILALKGKINLSLITLELIESINEILGDNVFTKGGELYITGPDFMVFPDQGEILEGDTKVLNAIVVSEHQGGVTYDIISGSRAGTTLNEVTGVLTTTENALPDSVLTIRAIHVSLIGETLTSESTLTIKRRIYPKQSDYKLVGPDKIEKELNEYKWSLK